jgi:hypothetical protein
MTAEMRLGFGEAAISTAASGKTLHPKTNDDDQWLPAAINMTAANWYAVELLAKMEEISTNKHTPIDRETKSSILKYVKTISIITSSTRLSTTDKLSALKQATKYARDACVKMAKQGILSKDENSSIGRALNRLTKSVSLASFDVGNQTTKNARASTLIETSTVDSDLETNGDPQIALAATRTLIKATAKRLDQRKQAEIDDLLKISDGIACKDATRILLPTLHEISTGAKHDEITRKNASYLKKWLTKQPHARQPLERALSPRRAECEKGKNHESR